MLHHCTSSIASWSLALICLILTCILPCKADHGPPTRFRAPGIGFGLTPDYGTAAIYFSNGSFVDVARIEGSPAYKSFMRKDVSSSAQVSLCDALPSSLQQVTLDFCTRHPDSASAISLLRALKLSVEGYLGTTFCFADMVLPDTSQTYQIDVLEKSLKAVGLRQSLAILNAGKLALVANHVSMPVGSEFSEQVVLSLDYSNSGLNTILFCDDEGIIDVLRQDYSPKLGAENAADGHREALKSAIQTFLAPPFGHSLMGRKLPHRIDKLVLYGDMSSSEQFRGLLRDVLSAELVEKAHIFDPVFAGAVGMAEASHKNMDDFDFGIKPAMGCRWRSKLYSGERDEL